MDINIDKLWAYNYKLEYYCTLFEENRICTGIVLAENTKDAFRRLEEYYLENDEEFHCVTIIEKLDGEVFPSLVFESDEEEY